MDAGPLHLVPHVGRLPRSFVASPAAPCGAQAAWMPTPQTDAGDLRAGPLQHQKKMVDTALHVRKSRFNWVSTIVMKPIVLLAAQTHCTHATRPLLPGYTYLQSMPPPAPWLPPAPSQPQLPRAQPQLPPFAQPLKNAPPPTSPAPPAAAPPSQHASPPPGKQPEPTRAQRGPVQRGPLDQWPASTRPSMAGPGAPASPPQTMLQALMCPAHEAPPVLKRIYFVRINHTCRVCCGASTTYTSHMCSTYRKACPVRLDHTAAPPRAPQLPQQLLGL